jgi:large subunit ribosomal protein L29
MVSAAELRELPEDMLLEQLENAKEELFNLRFQLATGELDNPARMKMVRHDVARILTVLRERESEQQLEADVARADAQAVEEGGARRRLLRRSRRSSEAAAPGPEDTSEPTTGGGATHDATGAAPDRGTARAGHVEEEGE